MPRRSDFSHDQTTPIIKPFGATQHIKQRDIRYNNFCRKKILKNNELSQINLSYNGQA